MIVGGESGPSARSCDVAWLRSIVQQCQQAGVAAFVKQLGSNPTGFYPSAQTLTEALVHVGAWLKGKADNPAEWPADLRVQEFPAVRS